MWISRPIWALAVAGSLLAGISSAAAEIGLISPQDARKLIDSPDASKRPLMLDTRGGYKAVCCGSICGMSLSTLGFVCMMDRGRSMWLSPSIPWKPRKTPSHFRHKSHAIHSRGSVPCSPRFC